MNKLLLLSVLIGGAALLASCVRYGGRDAPLVVNVNGVGEDCRVTVEGERVASDRLFEIARGATKHRGIVVYAKGAPYKCVGGAVITLQRAGMVSVHAVMWAES